MVHVAYGPVARRGHAAAKPRGDEWPVLLGADNAARARSKQQQAADAEASNTSASGRLVSFTVPAHTLRPLSSIYLASKRTRQRTRALSKSLTFHLPFADVSLTLPDFRLHFAYAFLPVPYPPFSAACRQISCLRAVKRCIW